MALEGIKAQLTAQEDRAQKILHKPRPAACKKESQISTVLSVEIFRAANLHTLKLLPKRHDAKSLCASVLWRQAHGDLQWFKCHFLDIHQFSINKMAKIRRDQHAKERH
eukprot:1144894-Pelagomonas_calceolata.AAC.5